MLKGLFYCILLSSLVSCSAIKPIATSSNANKGKSERNPPRKINSVEVAPESKTSKRVFKNNQRPSLERGDTLAVSNLNMTLSGDIEASNALQFKYALLLDVPVEAVTNQLLLDYFEEWYGTPYRYGGSTKEGIDCSAFTAGCMGSIFGVSIPRTVREQYLVCRPIEKNNLQEGDLVFFKSKSGLSHVGIYLVNNKFIHASTSSGVMISDLNEPYYSSRYSNAGRTR